MKCRINIKGRKIWVDDKNKYGTRPPLTEITLYRDGEPYQTVTPDSSGDGAYKFPCLYKWKNKLEKYVYTVDEPVVPDGYTKQIQGYKIINTLINVPLNGVKTWNDNFNEKGARPPEITVRLFRNGAEIASLQAPAPIDTEETSSFIFGELPFADPQGVPYKYTVEEDPVENYETAVSGLNIINTYKEPIVP